jgi:hypothetical protein
VCCAATSQTRGTRATRYWRSAIPATGTKRRVAARPCGSRRSTKDTAPGPGPLPYPTAICHRCRRSPRQCGTARTADHAPRSAACPLWHCAAAEIEAVLRPTAVYVARARSSGTRRDYRSVWHQYGASRTPGLAVYVVNRQRRGRPTFGPPSDDKSPSVQGWCSAVPSRPNCMTARHARGVIRKHRSRHTGSGAWTHPLNQMLMR